MSSKGWSSQASSGCSDQHFFFFLVNKTSVSSKQLLLFEIRSCWTMKTEQLKKRINSFYSQITTLWSDLHKPGHRILSSQLIIFFVHVWRSIFLQRVSPWTYRTDWMWMGCLLPFKPDLPSLIWCIKHANGFGYTTWGTGFDWMSHL